ncbi:uncharacterized protein LOC110989710 [Acanthaster planci]|uniref:Uncharacterized protein LOC110989710 n=1 Tax=Acanthaster planci TaxID=133434 RepID=A0A8B7ZY08_ACAPL|nr:uncharacterized protein LOC110989710 [Acanthaster planci]
MSSMILVTSVFILVLMASRTCTLAAQNSTGLECYQCHGVMGEVTDCGVNLHPDDTLNTTRCAHSCAKIVTYMIDQKIAITRDCVEQCEDGCVKDIASHCYYCCNTTLCNGSAGLHDPTPSLGLQLCISLMLVTCPFVFLT